MTDKSPVAVTQSKVVAPTHNAEEVSGRPTGTGSSHNSRPASAGPGGFPIPPVMVVLGIDCSLSELSRGVGMTLGHMSRVMNGERLPSLEAASQIAVYLGISVDRLTAAILEVKMVKDRTGAKRK